MKHIKPIGLALVVMTAIFALSATSAGASTFLATVTGELTGKLVSLQKFQTKAGSIECTGLTVDGLESTLKTDTLKPRFQLSVCLAFALHATISPIKWLFHAHGEVSLEGRVTIKATGCEVTIPANQNLGTVKYKNVGGEIEIEPTITGLTSEGVGAACTYAQESKGTFTGNSRIRLIGGTLAWDA
jgi:hypothetical protein